MRDKKEHLFNSDFKDKNENKLYRSINSTKVSQHNLFNNSAEDQDEDPSDDEYKRPSQKRGSGNMSRHSKAGSLRDLADMEDKLSKRYGDNYTT